MANTLQNYLQVSAQLYKHLSEIPKGEDRIQYIAKIEQYLATRGELVNTLKQQDFKYNSEDKAHATLYELDEGIKQRLQEVFSLVKEDIKKLYNAKRNEIHYIDPYDKLRNLDARYFDGKK